MDHAEVLERLEVAAAEPGALDRLMAGDTPDSMAIAGHLAGCPACAADLEAIRRTADVAREAIRSEPGADLRERTLAYVRVAGRPRGSADVGSEAGRPGDVHLPSASPPELPMASPPGLPPPGRAASRGVTRRRAGWAVAAAVVLIVASAAGGYLLAGARDDDARQAQQREIAILADAAATSVRVSSAADAQQVALSATSGAPDASGSVVFSASVGELVATATDLPAPGGGQEYGCWVEVAGQRQRLGRMYQAGDIWTWAGPAAGLGALPPGSTFGVSLGERGGGPGSTPVLTGTI
jgi:Anti-sigma-K factor rskA, C-terminal